MDWNEYENITRYIYQTLGQGVGVKVESYGNSCKVEGKSGVKHQIDVLTIHSDGIHTYKTAIECKYWKEKIDKVIVMKVAEIIEDTGINKGVIVTKAGFTKDGISYAKYRNIGLVELKEIEERAVSEPIGLIGIKSQLRRPEITRIKIDNVGPELDAIHIPYNFLRIRLVNGEEISFDSFLLSFKKELHEYEPYKSVKKYFKFSDAAIINNKTKSLTPIRGIELTGHLTVKDFNLKWHIVDEIWLIMKSLFEGKSFTISRTGGIREEESVS